MQIKIFFKTLFLRIIYLFRNKKYKSVYFNSFNGQYSDNPRAISELIHRIDPSIHLIWYLKKGVNVPDYINCTYSRFYSKILQVCADAWVMNNNSAPDLGDVKGKNTFFVMTWHGDRGFKKVGWATQNRHVTSFDGRYFDTRDVDLFTSASACGELVASEGLHYTGEILKVGCPRNDKLVKTEDYSEYAFHVKKELGVENDLKILLYAPTYRDNLKSAQEVDIDIEHILDLLESKGDRWLCLVRAHSSSKGLKTRSSSRIKDVSHHGDMADLLLIADCLITDYSSCSCDFILTGRPCVLAQFDRSEYEKSSREFWYNPDETGFIVAKTQKELDNIIVNLFKYDHKMIDNNVLNYYGTYESGRASEVVAKRIVDWIYLHHH